MFVVDLKVKSMEPKTKRKKKVSIDTTGWNACKYEGVDYLLPPSPEQIEHRFSGLILDIGENESIHSQGGDRYLILPRCKQKKNFIFMFDEIDMDFEPLGNNPVQLAIYEKGKSTPIAYYEMKPDFTLLTEQATNYNVKATEYFFYVGNALPGDKSCNNMIQMGNGFAMHIHVLENGIRMKHPEFLDVDISSRLSLHLHLSFAINPKKDILTCTCYDESLRVVAESNKMNLIDEDPTVVSLPLEARGWWLDGRYRVIISHNSLPYAMICFDCIDCYAENVEQVEFSPTSPYMMLQSHVNKSGTDSSFCNACGCRNIKMKVLEKRASTHFLEASSYSISSENAIDKALILKMFQIIYPKRPIHFVDCNDILNLWTQGKKMEDLDEQFEFWDLVVFYNFSSILDIHNVLIDDIFNQTQFEMSCSIILFGTNDELNRLFEIQKEWKSIIPSENQWQLEPYTDYEQIRIVEDYFRRKNIRMRPETKEILVSTLRKKRDLIRDWRKGELESWLNSDVMCHMKQRILESNSFSEELCCMLQPEDIWKSKFHSTQNQSYGDFESSIKDLDELVGLGNIKRHLKRLFIQMAFQQKRKLLGLKNVKEVLPHMIFTGNPGTGKTTVARMVGKIFKDLGLLKEGKVISVERTHLVGKYIGETEQKMTELLKTAHGNVLFIDEAYSLCDNNQGDRKDYGCRVLESLLPILAEPTNDILIILAGYEKEMNQMLELNPGMKGRFPYSFRFEDFTHSELNEMAQRLLKQMDYELEKTASICLDECIRQAVKNKDRFFHNGRWVTQMVEKGILGAMSERLYDVEPKEQNRDLFRTVTEEDVRLGFEEMVPRKHEERRTVGFR